MTGRIIRIISNLYTVSSNNKEYLCRARGKFKNDKLTPLVGDIVEFSEEQNYIMEIHSRKNELSRPPIANVDSCIIITSCTRPNFSAFLLDKMLTNVILANIRPIICFSKYDLLTQDDKKEFDELIAYYNKIGIPAEINNNVSKILDLVKGEIVVLTGQTGVGKSTFLNKINPKFNLETNDISASLGRGKHTTRHVELFKVADTLIADTPGFSALEIMEPDKLNIRFTFPEFNNEACKFSDCKHLNESGCQIKEDLKNNNILPSRYESYRKMVEK